MSINTNELNKYIFDPKNPRQCKSYNLLLQIAKKENLVYLSSDFIAIFLENTISNTSFNDQIWDKPNNYSNFDINDKIKLFINSLSEKEYIQHIFDLKINDKNFMPNKLFSNFFDLHPNGYIKKILKYDNSLIKSKLYFSSNYSFEGYMAYKDNYVTNKPFLGHKILFTNNKEDLKKTNDFFDVSSIVITTKLDTFIYEELDNNFNFISKVDEDINSHIKPIFLKNSKDLKLLLKVLENDLNKASGHETSIEKNSTLNEIKIKDFFSIKDLELKKLKDKKEIYILGENGDGKTLLLQALAIGLKGITEGNIFDFVKKTNYIVNIIDSEGDVYNAEGKQYKNLFAYGAHRHNSCQMKEDETGYLTLFNASLDLKNPIEWLKYLDYSEKSGNNNIISVQKAQELLREILNSEIEIEITPDEVSFLERGSKVNFEQLSAGYKGVITIISDLLIRLSDNQPYIENITDFEGIVLIDEVELHLHPKWKYVFVSKLRKFFPKIQFILATHSPTVILGASSEAVFYKIYKDNGEVKISNQILNKGYTSNSLISSPLFDMETISTVNYTGKISSDDYIYEKIHKIIAEKINNKIQISNEEISKIIDAELDKL